MKIVSWNCNGGFRKKFQNIDKLNADIYVISECENPELINDKSYKNFACNHLWIGHNKNKGLGIFAKSGIKLEDNHWNSYSLEYFISCKINNSFNLLAVWACGNYIEDICVYVKIHLEKFNNIIICGDFNSNCIWDAPNTRRTHSTLLNDLEKKKLYSLYHVKNSEEQGKEKTPTFYMYKNINKPYHTDYFFCENKELNTIDIGEYSDWLSISDHMPISATLI